ncbi:hypothetical protein Tco_0585138 [Tanacetum coccineum]
MDATEAPSLAKRLKAGKVVKKRTFKSSQQLVDEGVLGDEPRFEDEEADIMQKVMEESIKDTYPVPRGLLPPVGIRELEPGKFQPLPEVQGKGKEKVGEEQVAQVLLNLQTPKKKNPAEQFIFQRRTPATAEPSALKHRDVRLEDPTSSAATLSSLRNLNKEISFTNQFLAKKSQEDKPEKTNTEAEVQSLVMVPIHQDTSSVPLMTTPVIDLIVS